MSIEATVWAWDQSVLPSRKLILLTLADSSNEHGECQLPIDYLAARACVTRASIFTAIKDLESVGLVEIERGAGKRNVYRLRMGAAQQ